MAGILESTLYLSVTAIVILLFKRIFKNKLSAKWHVWIWALLAIRLVLPALPESSFSIFNAFDMPEKTQEALVVYDEAKIRDYPEYEDEVKYESNTVRNTSPSPMPDENRAQNRETPKVKYTSPIKVEDVPVNDDYNTQSAEQTNKKEIDYDILADTLRFSGAGLLFLYFVVVYIVCVNRTDKNKGAVDAETELLVNECKKLVGVRRKVSVVESGNSPMLMGLVRATIVLPDGYNENEKKDIIIHELCHLKGGDIYLLWLSMIILCLNWFNPVVWICFFVFRRDIEVYCDERVLKYVDSKKEYAALLVKTALKKNSFIAGTTSLQNGEKEVERRVKYMAYFKKPGHFWTTIIILLAVVIGVVCLTNPVGDEKKEGGHKTEVFHDKDETPDYIEVLDVDDYYSIGKVRDRIVDETINEDTTIYYPQIIHLVDGVGESNANPLLKMAAYEYYYITGGAPTPNHPYQTWTTDYTIAHSSEKLLSVLFNNEMTSERRSGYNIKHAINIALPAGYSYDIYEIFVEDFCHRIKHETFRYEDGSELSAEDVLEFEQKFKSEFSEMNYDLYYSYYFSDGKLHIILDNNVVICADIESVDYLIKDMSHPIWHELGVQSPTDEDFSLIYNGFTFSYDTTIDEITSFFPTSERWEEPQNYLFVAGCPTSRRISLNYPDGHNPDISVICIENLETGESFIERIIVHNDNTVKVTSGEYINAYEGVLGEHIYEFELHIDSPESLAIDLYQKSLMGEDVSLLPFDGKINLLYASGAGAWGDYITLSADGSYTRNFHDSNMGQIGEENPNGTVYFDNETGKFDMLKLDDFTYMLTVKESTHEYGYSEEWIEDGVKYVSTAPEHSDVGTVYILALPETPIAAIPISVMEWDLDRIWSGVAESTLSYYALYPSEGGIGYFAYESINDEENEEIPRYPANSTYTPEKSPTPASASQPTQTAQPTPVSLSTLVLKGQGTQQMPEVVASSKETKTAEEIKKVILQGETSFDVVENTTKVETAEKVMPEIQPEPVVEQLPVIVTEPEPVVEPEPLAEPVQEDVTPEYNETAENPPEKILETEQKMPLEVEIEDAFLW